MIKSLKKLAASCIWCKQPMHLTPSDAFCTKHYFHFYVRKEFLYDKDTCPKKEITLIYALCNSFDVMSDKYVAFTWRSDSIDKCCYYLSHNAYKMELSLEDLSKLPYSEVESILKTFILFQ